MNCWIQLRRRPGKTILGIMLILLAGALLYVSVGQCLAALQAQAGLERDYTTIALPTARWQGETILDENGESAGLIFYESQPQEVEAFLASLPGAAPEIVKGVYNHGLVSGYCPSLTPLNCVNAEGCLRDEETSVLSADPNSDPYDCAIFVIRLDEIGSAVPFASADDPDAAAYGVTVALTGTIQEVVSLQEGYADPTGRALHINLRLESEAELQSLALRKGQDYLIYGTDYFDLDWFLRRELALFMHVNLSEIDLSNIEPISDEQKAVFEEQARLHGTESNEVALYAGGPYLNQDQLNNIGTSRITVCANPMVNGHVGADVFTIYSTYPYQTIPASDYIAYYGQPGMVAIQGPASDFLRTTEDPAWLRAQESLRINNHAFPVIATPNLMAIAQFSMEDAMLSEGRGFTEREYQDGGKVCVISEAVAAASGISVGDSIPIRLYESDPVQPPLLKPANPTANYYSHRLGFATEEETYQVVGLYRQKNAWMISDYAFTPNTIFVPEAAVSCGTETLNTGIFQSITLENGTQDAMEALLAEKNLDGLFAYYDQGYSEIQSSLENYFSVSISVVAVGLCVWLGLILIYILLFPMQQRKEIQRMWALGVPRRQIRRHLLGTGAGILLPGTVLGGILGAVLLEAVISRIGANAGAEAAFSLSAGVTLGLILAQALCLAVILYLVTGYLLRGLEGSFGRKRL